MTERKSNEYRECVIKTNKPVYVSEGGDIISAQMLEKHGELIDRKEAIKRFKALKEFAHTDRDYVLEKAYETVIKELRKLTAIVWES